MREGGIHARTNCYSIFLRKTPCGPGNTAPGNEGNPRSFCRKYHGGATIKKQTASSESPHYTVFEPPRPYCLSIILRRYRVREIVCTESLQRVDGKTFVSPVRAARLDIIKTSPHCTFEQSGCRGFQGKFRVIKIISEASSSISKLTLRPFNSEMHH